MRTFRLLLLILLVLSAGALMANQTQRYDFRVLLDDNEIGHHRFVVSERDAETTVTSEARFDVKFLFINAYTYTHANSETWQGDCLYAIDAATDDNGESLFVRGETVEQQLLLETPDGRRHIEGCVRTFAYWDPQLLRAQRLLNAQTGELVDVDVRALGESTIEVRGKPVRAHHYRLSSDELDIDLWYSDNRQWLALESTVGNGSRLRYQPQ
jgi:hypothetical protein